MTLTYDANVPYVLKEMENVSPFKRFSNALCGAVCSFTSQKLIMVYTPATRSVVTVVSVSLVSVMII